MGALHLFPSPFPDETLHSVLSRLHRLSGHRFARQTLSEVFGTHLVVATNNLPSHLTALASRLPGEPEAVLRRLIEQCTILPYFRPFLSRHQLTLCESCMSGETAGAAKIGIGAVASRIGARNEFRLCAACMQEDEAKYGCAYWHRAHCLPGVQICFQHHTPLLNLPPAQVQELRHELFLPDAPSVMASASRRPITPTGVEIHDQLAIRSHALLSQGPLRIERAALQACYRNRAHEVDWVDRHGRLIVPPIRECAAQYAMAFQGEPDFQFLTNDEWPLQLLRKHRKSMHPLKHLALMQLLGLPIEALSLVQNVAAENNLRPSKWKLNSWPGFLQDRDARRSRFLAAPAGTSLRKAPDYMWLYRNDREWHLDALAQRKVLSTPHQNRLNWDGRDEILADKIGQLAKELIAGHHQQRITSSYLALQTGVVATVEKCASKLPLTLAALGAAAESVEDFQHRRVEQIVSEMNGKGQVLKRWEILRRAGLKEPLNSHLELRLRQLLGEVQ
ncbi:TnsD family Tn7-like transposition protein [Massilia sp. SR12]